MVGIANRIDENIDFEAFAQNINTLYQNQDFVDSITRATSDDKVVAERHRLFNEYINQYVQ